MKKNLVVYWIHKESEIDIRTEGYVGITSDIISRTKAHKKKDWFFGRIVDVILEGSQDYCKMIERNLRPKMHIGLNVASGGGMPPNVKGIKRSKETRQLISENNVGMKGKKHSKETIDKMISDRTGKPGTPHTDETKKKLSEIALQRTSPNGMTGKKHTDETKRKISEKALERREAKRRKESDTLL